VYHAAANAALPPDTARRDRQASIVHLKTLPASILCRES
jgi:hypothetical protein